MRRSVLLLLVSSVGLCVQPAAREIIQRSVVVNDADWDALPKYSHRETDNSWKLDAAAERKSSKAYEILMIDGSPYSKLVAVNGAPLSAREQQKEEMKLKREIGRRRRESQSDRAARIAKYNRERQDNHLLMNELIRAFDFSVIGEDQIHGHPVYALDATPRRDYRPPNQKAKALTGMKGRLWIDKRQYHWVKVEAEVIRPVNFEYFIAKIGPGTRFVFEQQPVGGNLWLPSRFEQTVNARILGIKSHRTREEEIYSDYRRANAQVSRR